MSDGAEKKQDANQPPQAADPTAAWRELSNATMDTWAKAMVQFVNTKDYAKSTGAMLNAYIEASAPQKKIYEQLVTRALAQSNMPSREDVLNLAERLTNLEMRLDDIDAKLDVLLSARAPSPARAAAPVASARDSVNNRAVKKKKHPEKRK